MPKLPLLDYLRDEGQEDDPNAIPTLENPSNIPSVPNNEDYMQDMPTYETSDEMDQEIQELHPDIQKYLSLAKPQGEYDPKAEAKMQEIQPEQQGMSDLLSRYKDAQNSRRDSNQTAQIMRSADLIATGLAGKGATKAPDELFKGIENLGELPLKDIQEEIKGRPEIQKVYTEDQLSDANSEVSGLARNLIKQKFPKLPIDGMSAKELESLGFKIGSLFSNSGQYGYQMGPAIEVNGKPAMTRFKRDTGAYEVVDPDTGKWMPATGQRFYKPDVRTNNATGGIVQITPTGGIKELALPGVTPSQTQSQTDTPNEIELRSSSQIFDTLNPAQRKYLIDKVEPEANKELSEFQDQLDAANRIKSSLHLGSVNQDMLRAVQNAFARLNGEKGMMSEADVSGYKGRQDILSKLESLGHMMLGGKISDGDRKFLLAFADEFQKQSTRFMSQRAKKHIANIQRNTGLNPRDSSELLNLDSYYSGLSKMSLRRYDPGTILKIKDKQYKVDKDGNTLIPMEDENGK